MHTNNPITFANLSKNSQLRLLDLALDPLVFGISCIPFCGIAFAMWAYSVGISTTGLLILTIFYIFAGFCIRKTQKIYKKHRATLNDELVFTKWLPIIKAISLAHGLGLTIPFLMLIGQATFEFNLLLLLAIAGIIAAFATHLTPILVAFLYLFLPCWTICLIIMPWVFPSQWPILMFLCLVYAWSMYKHALIGHQFFVKQMMLEDESATLAENYRLAKNTAEAALQAKNLFLTTASHDLRQPVHAMGFLIESIARRNVDSNLIPALNDLKLSVRSLTQMFNALLDLSKIEAGAVSLRKEAIGLQSLIEETALLFAEEAKASHLTLKIKLTHKNATVFADALLLKQSLSNLIHNALRYTKQGGVLITARKRQQTWLIEVWDTGVGIATHEQHKVYSPFFRHKHAWQIDDAGHGLGLAVVARCCTLMGAQYGLSSTLGCGSRFWLKLPAADNTHLQANSQQQKATSTPLNHHNYLLGCCLIVEDEPQVTHAWQVLLSTWGLTVKCADSLIVAMSALDKGFVPQVILCDQRLRSGESGFEVLRALLQRCPTAKGAMVSGEFNSVELMLAENEGYIVLHKPVAPELLFDLLASWLVAPLNVLNSQ